MWVSMWRLLVDRTEGIWSMYKGWSRRRVTLPLLNWVWIPDRMSSGEVDSSRTVDETPRVPLYCLSPRSPLPLVLRVLSVDGPVSSGSSSPPTSSAVTGPGPPRCRLSSGAGRCARRLQDCVEQTSLVSTFHGGRGFFLSHVDTLRLCLTLCWTDR